ncbi:NAD(P)H-hydrate dehydratase [uncultured Sphingomonas sp.]|uniref:NAD(P)H-hydrate dehydratase n=1 Tax=uncultured Sphingomonas sp. TaxID=158754 RepID=UPI0035C9ACA0
MIPIEGRPILIAAGMKAAEQASGIDLFALMTRAGEGVGRAAARLAAGAEMLVLCGPGNNGGDGYVAAAALRRAGHEVRIAASAPPASDLARRAAAGWDGPVEALADVAPAPVLIDALFGTGLSRPLEPAIADPLAGLATAARLTLAVDLPSGVGTDDGGVLGAAGAQVTLALGALKPAHLLEPAASLCGQVRLLDLGTGAPDDWRVVARPQLAPPTPNSQKYTRGLVVLVGGAMPGATLLAAEAAMRAGAGYGLLLADDLAAAGPHALVRRRWSAAALDDRRIGAVVIGPGLGREDAARAKLDAALASPHPLVIDGDALQLLDLDRLAARDGVAVLTPHGGEFAHLFGAPAGSKIDAALAAARRARAVVAFKGADTVIAAPDGQGRVYPRGSAWLSTAGTGDVLAGVAGALLAAKLSPLDAAAGAVWLHAEAARRCGASFIADDLARALTPARASL